MSENKKFEKYFKRLIALSINIINEYERIATIDRKRFITGIKKYQAIFERTEKEEHVEIVKEVYEKYKFIFTKDIEDMDSLETSNISFTYGDKKHNASIKISKLYKFAHEIENSHNNIIKTLGTVKIPKIKYEFLLTLLQLLKSVSDKQEVFEDNIRQLKLKLNKKVKEQAQVKNPLEGFISPLLNQMGLNLGNENLDLNKMLSSVMNIFNDDKIKNLVNNIKGNPLDNPSEFLTKVLDTVASPEVAGKIRDDLIKNNEKSEAVQEVEDDEEVKNKTN